MAFMRAKMRVGSVFPAAISDGVVTHEAVKFYGVPKNQAYPADGSDEDNTFAKFSPSVSLDIVIANPALIGKLTPGDIFYVDFTKVEG